VRQQAAPVNNSTTLLTCGGLACCFMHITLDTAQPLVWATNRHIHLQFRGRLGAHVLHCEWSSSDAAARVLGINGSP
jgi:hypothetical protein